MTTPATRWVLYGANGYTGELIAREAVSRGMKPLLAGRSAGKIAPLAQELGCESAAFAVDDHTSMLRAIDGAAVVLNCAGPFSQTAAPLMQACLAAHIHYIDITGEIDVFELARSVNQKAERAGIVLCPGVGFDVVPTDCLAAQLKQALPDATHLALGFDSRGGASPGTAKTAVEGLGLGGRIRKDGVLTEVPLAQTTRKIDFGDGERVGVLIPWGDVSTAYYSTGIPNIEVFLGATADAAKQMRRVNTWRPLLRRSAIQALLKYMIGRRVRGPDATQRNSNPTFVWGEVRNGSGDKRTARIRTANGYAVTAHAALGVLTRLLAGIDNSGYATPSLLMGADFVNRLPGSSETKFD
jgi:short subunit dehydrogenase-like uncharacterized protein